MFPAVAIILINWNGQPDTLACLESLRHDLYPAKRVLVVDNGSSDDSVSVIRRTYPEVDVLEAGVNLGFTGGNNLGIRHVLATGPTYIYLLNNDTISEPDALTKLVEAHEADQRYGVVTPVIHYFDRPDQAWFAGSRLNLSLGDAIHDNSEVPARSAPVRSIPWAAGCAMLMPASLVRQLDGFDERFFLTWEDVDLSLRVRSAGYDIGLVPAARIYHKVSRSFRGMSSLGLYYHVRNNLLVLQQHAGNSYKRAAWRVALNRSRDGLRSIVRPAPGTRPISAALATARAIADHVAGRYGRRI